MCDDEDNYIISHGPTEEVAQYKTVMELTGCNDVIAIHAILKAKGDIVEAVDSLLKKPVCKGDTYLPSKPKINDGLSDEQKALCERGRWLQDKVNEVISVAHAKTRTQPDPLVGQSEAPPAEVTLPTFEQVELTSTTESSQDSPEQTTPQVGQSELPL